MKNLIITWCRFICKIINEYWWPHWSNFRWRNSIRHNIDIPEQDQIHTIPDIRRTACKIYNVFEWTEDDITELMDSIVPPPQNYQNYLSGGVYDDCDGFHSTMYHFLHNSGIECYLLSVNAMKLGHCVLLFKLNSLWYINDYISVTKGYTTAQEAIDAYNHIFELEYKTESPVFYNGLILYDYTDGKFKNQPINDIT